MSSTQQKIDGLLDKLHQGSPRSPPMTGRSPSRGLPPAKPSLPSRQFSGPVLPLATSPPPLASPVQPILTSTS